MPSIGLVVAGDVAYNDVQLYLAESNAQTRHEWISGLDKIESLKPHAVIAGHKRPTNDDSPRTIEETRQYIRDFDKIAGTTTWLTTKDGNSFQGFPANREPLAYLATMHVGCYILPRLIAKTTAEKILVCKNRDQYGMGRFLCFTFYHNKYVVSLPSSHGPE